MHLWQYQAERTPQAEPFCRLYVVVRQTAGGGYMVLCRIRTKQPALGRWQGHPANRGLAKFRLMAARDAECGLRLITRKQNVVPAVAGREKNNLGGR